MIGLPSRLKLLDGRLKMSVLLEFLVGQRPGLSLRGSYY